MNDDKKQPQTDAELDELSLDELENVTGGLGFGGFPGFPGFPGLPPLIKPPVWGKPVITPPRCMAALPSDLIELVESIEDSEAELA